MGMASHWQAQRGRWAPDNAYEGPDGPDDQDDRPGPREGHDHAGEHGLQHVPPAMASQSSCACLMASASHPLETSIIPAKPLLRSLLPTSDSSARIRVTIHDRQEPGGSRRCPGVQSRSHLLFRDSWGSRVHAALPAPSELAGCVLREQHAMQSVCDPRVSAARRARRDLYRRRDGGIPLYRSVDQARSGALRFRAKR